jgi:hypothetical protein
MELRLQSPNTPSWSADYFITHPLYLHRDEMLITATAGLVIQHRENRDWIWETLAFHAFCYTNLTILVQQFHGVDVIPYSPGAHENITETISCLQYIVNLHRHSSYGNKAILRYETVILTIIMTSLLILLGSCHAEMRHLSYVGMQWLASRHALLDSIKPFELEWVRSKSGGEQWQTLHFT